MLRKHILSHELHECLKEKNERLATNYTNGTNGKNTLKQKIFIRVDSCHSWLKKRLKQPLLFCLSDYQEGIGSLENKERQEGVEPLIAVQLDHPEGTNALQNTKGVL